jgi:hypothetical protein
VANYGQILARVNRLSQNHLDEDELRGIINDCHRELLERYPWARRRTNAVFNSVAPTSSVGTVALTQGSAFVTGTGTSFNNTNVGQQIRLGGGNYAPFTILSVTSATALQLSNPWPSASLSGSGYTMFQALYSISGADEILAVKQRVDLEPTTVEQINRKDPARNQSANPSLAWAPDGRDSSDNAQFELWPWPSGANNYTVEYLAKHIDFRVAADRSLVPGYVVESYAVFQTVEALASRSGDERWFKHLEDYGKMYQEALAEALSRDKKQWGRVTQVQDTVGGNRYGGDVLYNTDLD